MSAEIIRFAPRNTVPTASVLPVPAAALTPTAKNKSMRRARWEEWRKADALTQYWEARLNLQNAVMYANNCGLKEGLTHNEADRTLILDKYDDALCGNLLTPAPTIGDVHWKRRQLRKSHRFNETIRSYIEKAIAADVAFLATHPTRRARSRQN